MPHPVRNTSFQFHSGSIRSAVMDELRRRTFQFQFHSGSIRSHVWQNPGDIVLGFNSIVVRLEASATPTTTPTGVSVSIP